MSVEMSNTGLKINYSVRPAKNIERKMMKDVFSRLFVFDELAEYQYIGFGSKYFTDFTFFHKTLGCKKMISIECDSMNIARYEFNKPYEFIQMHFGYSYQILPKLKYEDKTIVWLDYDYSFNEEVMTDLIFLVENLTSGSVLSVSFSCDIPKIHKLKEKYPNIEKGFFKKYFEEIFGDIGIDLDDRGWNQPNKFSNFINEKVYSRLLSAISIRNSDLRENKKLNLEQIFYFSYADGIPMITFGWLIFSEEDRQKYNLLNLGNFNFYSNRIDQPYLIETCHLTIKEIRSLMSKMPISEEENVPIDEKIIPAEMQKNFAKNYQYFPSFHEVEAY